MSPCYGLLQLIFPGYFPLTLPYALTVRIFLFATPHAPSDRIGSTAYPSTFYRQCGPSDVWVYHPVALAVWTHCSSAPMEYVTSPSPARLNHLP